LLYGYGLFITLLRIFYNAADNDLLLRDMKLFVQYLNFLSHSENKEIYNHTLQIENQFANATVLSDAKEFADWRKAKIVFNETFGGYVELFKDKVLQKHTEVCNSLGIPAVLNYDIDVQLTAHNDGDYFKEHTDCGHEETNNRVLTFVYYFNKEPKPFSGGELLINEGNKVLIEPENNMIVFFNPNHRHAVQTVHCQENIFSNSRFTLNGWILEKFPSNIPY
jgi:SM-20-related protein